ncbi:hypothetical protein SEA_EMMA1919_223 [Streptomyces phage Emma1919]|uniref:Uncharacterized protein n=2 Tax=Gilsonvirus gilson TaxID=2846398 RepID=A0A3Q9R4W9_9CAUD|nr:hypothetical protein HWB98_gp064 [Streptomyces phage Gilson]QQV92562.1 hypothetical protein SEA_MEGANTHEEKILLA_225 [Streptomyces phage MeganTheeKilla]QZE11327.1 hypothetical protein SEA_FORREST_223 [Streptomyces phage Forrest]QZE11555.1 hypothetical protein SEA_JADA_222 [Streptomyces phage Jada]URQ04804.1 hypothetical protein SEA_EMMA1919_223 [Streptomyces phage Emma1919]AZU97265.1 hypothetical protein SEA_GILSON_220 [Streptomyces phage Gilson]
MENMALPKALRTKVVDGRVYFDLEQLLEIMYDVCNKTSVLATELRDPALATMTLGVANMCKALDDVLTVQKAAHGLTGRRATDSGSQSDSGGVAE